MNKHFTNETNQLTPEEYEKKIYDLEQLLEISKSLCTTLELKNLIESVLYISMAQMRVTGGGIFIYDSETSTFNLSSNYTGFELNASYDYKISSNGKFIEYISSAENIDSVYTPEELSQALSKNEDLEMLKTLKTSLIVPLVLNNRITGLLLLGERLMGTNADPYTVYERNEISTIASLAAIAVNNANLLEQSSTDIMTRLKQKYYFFNILTDRLDFASTHSQTVGVVMFDIDLFKKFNDTYGHACGDYVLQTVAKILKTSIRGNDLASRYGGEEFTVMLYNANKQESMQVAERIRKNIENYDFCYKDLHLKVTISGGVSVYSEDINPVTSAKALVDQADQALYISKGSGRNRITYADPALLAASESSVLHGPVVSE